MAGLLAALALAGSVAGAAGLRTSEASPQAAAAAADPWPTFRGPHESQFGVSSVVIPKNLSAALRWSWHHPGGRYHTVICGGPVVDAGGNFYLSTNDGVRKLSPQGQVLWHYKQHDNKLNIQASLWGGMVFGSTQTGVAFALDQKDGSTVWIRKLARTNGPDCGYPAAYDGVFVVGANEGHNPISQGGNLEVYGLNSSTGKTLWRFKPSMPVWNFAPLFTRNGTVAFMDFQGAVYAMGLRDGGLRWRTPVPGVEQSFGDGGAVLGPLGDIFSCSNVGHGDEGTLGLLRRLRLADGAVLWQQGLPQPCNSYPAVGRLGPGAELSVAVTPGSFMGQPNLHGSIMAFDVLTGAPRWRFNTQPYTGNRFMAKGDIEGFEERHTYDAGHDICLPAHWSSANIDGDGFVYAGRSDGYIYGVRATADAVAPAESGAALAKLDAGFPSSPGLEVHSWNADGASLHGAWAFAPGTVAFSSCDTLYVFNA